MEAKELKRKVHRLYRTKGRKDDYLKLLREYQEQFTKASKEYIEAKVTELKETNPAKAAAILKKLGGAPGDCGDEGQFTILSHQAENLTSEQSMRNILKYFTDISKEFHPLDVPTLPVRVKVKLLDRSGFTPTIEDYQVYNAIKSTKKPRSTCVPGDLPKKLIKEYSVEFAKPVAMIFRSILKSNKWPSKWTIEHGLALKKVKSLKMSRTFAL